VFLGPYHTVERITRSREMRKNVMEEEFRIVGNKDIECFSKSSLQGEDDFVDRWNRRVLRRAACLSDSRDGRA
jgi:hypothetical protein